MNIRPLVLALTATLIGAHSATGQLAFTLAGGVSLPVGNAGGASDPGYNVAAAASLGGMLVPVSLRLEGAWNAFDVNPAGTRTVAGGSLNAVFNVSQAPLYPYLIGGAGVYRQTTNTPVGTVTYSSARTAPALNGGAGIRFPLSGVSTFMEMRFHYIFPADGGASTRFIPVTFGITF